MRRHLTAALAATAIAFMSSHAPLFGQAVPADGEVTKIDPAAGKMTLRHGPIKNLDMDSMTMVFRVRDPAIFQAVKVGDRVTFEAQRVDGAITITRIERKK